MSNDWLAFWDNYRHAPARSEDDLFVQVGKTIGQARIPPEMFSTMIAGIVERLGLTPSDHLLDLCCGNGLVTYELGQFAGRLTGVDFAQHLIMTARQFKPRSNITYLVGDITTSLDKFEGQPFADGIPQKFLINDALAYFDAKTLGDILDNICNALGSDPFRFLVTGVPNYALRWNFYDTAERRARYEENSNVPGNTNDGLGRWWRKEEIERTCRERGLQASVSDQPACISNYRMDALIWRS